MVLSKSEIAIFWTEVDQAGLEPEIVECLAGEGPSNPDDLVELKK